MLDPLSGLSSLMHDKTGNILSASMFSMSQYVSLINILVLRPFRFQKEKKTNSCYKIHVCCNIRNGRSFRQRGVVDL